MPVSITQNKYKPATFIVKLLSVRHSMYTKLKNQWDAKVSHHKVSARARTRTRTHTHTHTHTHTDTHTHTPERNTLYWDASVTDGPVSPSVDVRHECGRQQ